MANTSTRNMFLFGLVKLGETGDRDIVDLFQQYKVDLHSLSNQLARE